VCRCFQQEEAFNRSSSACDETIGTLSLECVANQSVSLWIDSYPRRYVSPFSHRYNLWACTQCRKACSAQLQEANDPFQWLYDGKTIYTPTTAQTGVSLVESDYELLVDDIPLNQRNTENKEFKDWLASTDYRGRWRATSDYCALGSHDQTTFRSQMRAIFRHVLHQLAPNDADVVWDGIVDDETKRPARTKGG
jgi:hypothetical protein